MYYDVHAIIMFREFVAMVMRGLCMYVYTCMHGRVQMEASSLCVYSATYCMLPFADDLMLVTEKNGVVEDNLRMPDEVIQKEKQINWRKIKVPWKPAQTVKKGVVATCDLVKSEKYEGIPI